MIKVQLKDGQIKNVDKGTKILDIVKDISMGLYRSSVAAKIDGKVCDLRDEILQDCKLEVLTFDSKDGQMAFWHSTAHILAQAVKRLYPNAKLSIGPSLETGFFYDFDVEKAFTPEDLEKIEKEIKNIAKEKIEIERFYMSLEEALYWAEENKEPYKKQLIKEHGENGEKLSFYRQGDFIELCRGPHIINTSIIKSVKLTQTTGAYFKGDAKNKMLCRVYGVSFPKEAMLKEHLEMVEEAKKRDHRKIGKELDLYDIYEEGPGFPFFMPKGMVLRNELENFWKEEHRLNGYDEIKTPVILNRKLWETSGHWHHYKDNMYTTNIDDEDYAIKPMNCPGCMLTFKRKIHSYRDLPQRMGELGLVHRHELSGALHGLMRVRSFTQDDAHIFMTEEQMKDEIIGVIHLAQKIYSAFGFEYKVELSTQPEDSMGTKEQWNIAIDALRQALEEIKIPYKINEGDGAFYGPKIDFHLKDCIGRSWQCGTIQLDFQLPERFDVNYIDQNGEKKRPVIVHRALFGSLERFIGILTEHFAGAFPLWLSPVQVKVIPVSEKHVDYANKIKELIKQNGIRVEIDERNEKLGYKIREAQVLKIPYMLIVGDKEIDENKVGVRHRKHGDIGNKNIELFINEIKEDIKTKKIDV
ncbi:MAG: threonine--tRNA ligase [Oscillospiraceae bacterium]